MPKAYMDWGNATWLEFEYRGIMNHHGYIYIYTRIYIHVVVLLHSSTQALHLSTSMWGSDMTWHAHNQQHCVCNQTQIGIYSENATPPDRHPLQWLDAWGKFVVVFGMTMTAASFTLILLELLLGPAYVFTSELYKRYLMVFALLLCLHPWDFGKKKMVIVSVSCHSLAFQKPRCMVTVRSLCPLQIHCWRRFFGPSH